jgi:cell division protein FtsL
VDIMSGETFEYAIKKDIRNNPIVREVDRDRHREMWRSVGVGVFLVVVLLFSAWQHFELLRHGYRLEQMQSDRAAEAEINRHLRLEIDTLRSPARIERLAIERLQMVWPGPGDSSVIERVLPSSPPPGSVVARR